MKNKKKLFLNISYSEAIREALLHILNKDKNFVILGQGVTSPWYVGNTLKNFDAIYPDRIFDTPISESLITGAGIGASLSGLRPLIVHPRMDFMLYATDTIINQAAKWSYITGGASCVPLTIRAIINRGGSQGAQHSQSLHSLFAHIHGLRVLMPSTAKDAHDLLIASIKSNDPVIFIDDRWLYDNKQKFIPNYNIDIAKVKHKILKKGTDVTIVASSYFTYLSLEAEKKLRKINIFSEIIDLRVINPLKYDLIIKSVKKTKRLLVIDGSWDHCGLANQVISSILKKINLKLLKSNPISITLPDCPAPSSNVIEKFYYPNIDLIVREVKKNLIN
jgi:pyruvate dehydrogenase E1 component beta subunit